MRSIKNDRVRRECDGRGENWDYRSKWWILFLCIGLFFSLYVELFFFFIIFVYLLAANEEIRSNICKNTEHNLTPNYIFRIEFFIEYLWICFYFWKKKKIEEKSEKNVIKSMRLYRAKKKFLILLWICFWVNRSVIKSI